MDVYPSCFHYLTVRIDFFVETFCCFFLGSRFGRVDISMHRIHSFAYTLAHLKNVKANIMIISPRDTPITPHFDLVNTLAGLMKNITLFPLKISDSSNVRRGEFRIKELE